MVTKKKPVQKAKSAKKIEKKSVKKAVEEDTSEGVSLDDAFGDDEDVEYAEDHLRVRQEFNIPERLEDQGSSQSQHPASEKPAKVKKKGMSEKEMENELDEIERENGIKTEEPRGPVTITASKPIAALKKGDRVNIDGVACIVDAHYVLIDHGSTNEMALELYDAEEHDYQLRYFHDQVETTLELYELKEIMYIKKPMTKISW